MELTQETLDLIKKLASEEANQALELLKQKEAKILAEKLANESPKKEMKPWDYELMGVNKSNANTPYAKQKMSNALNAFMYRENRSVSEDLSYDSKKK